LDFEVGDRTKATYTALALRLEEKYNIKYLCTDKYEAYCYIKIAEKHVRTKAETALIEAKNSIVRHYLARFNRKTKRFSKALDMITASLRLLFNKELLLSIFV
jgi:insertion element IS1 protein InsB